MKRVAAIFAMMASSLWAQIQINPHSLGRPANLLLDADGYYISSQNPNQDYQRMYFVNIRKTGLTEQELAAYGKLHGFVPGRFAVMDLHPGIVETLSHKLHKAGLACGTLIAIDGDPAALVPKADPVPVIELSQDVSTIRQLVARVNHENIRADVTELSSIHTRHHNSSTGLGVPLTLAKKYQLLAEGRSDVSIDLFTHSTSRTNQKSLRVRILGTHAPDEIIVLGSHIDSISGYFGSSRRSPGADDNASGTSTNLEIFRVLMETGVRFARTIEIHGYAAEEIGLVGSADMAKAYAAADANVVAMVQHDMNIYRDGDEDMIWFVSNSTNESLNNGLISLNQNYVGAKWNRGVLRNGTSDHASWTRQGYPSAFPFENPTSYNRAIHSANDDPEHANSFTQAGLFAKLGLAFLGHYAGLAQ